MNAARQRRDATLSTNQGRKETRNTSPFFFLTDNLGVKKILGVKGAKPHWVNFFEEKRGEAFFT